MTIEESRLHLGRKAVVYPFSSTTFTMITAVAEPANELLGEPAHYRVNWPGIGSVDTATTRLFAQALLAAADWVDEQKAKQEEAK